MTFLRYVVFQILWAYSFQAEVQPCDYPQVENIELSGYYQSNRERAFPAQIGSSVYYTCANGYVTATGHSWVSISCTRDGWDPAPKCIKICYAPNVENGGTRYSSWRKFREGETISYSCHRAYLPENEQDRITCTKNGWSPTPRCVPENVTCGPPPEVVNADIIHADNEMHLPGTRVQYKCHRGFQIVGSDQVICENREWSQLPTCQDVTCGSPPDIVGGWIADTKRERYFPGEIIRYRCRQGQTLSGPARVVCKEGNWSPLGTPECNEGSGRCGPPPIIENGDITTFPLSHYERHSTVKYKCKHLYILEGSEYAKCDSGQWTEPPTCIEPCTASEQDMADNNIRLKWVSGEKLYFASGDVIEFDCIRGYVRDPASPPFRVQCQEGKLLYPRCGSRAPAGTSV